MTTGRSATPVPAPGLSSLSLTGALTSPQRVRLIAAIG
jgi:hypothetical protein